jgi:NDP-sugar pyrophosphorylase family protein
MILAAGFGRRLRPISAFYPKPTMRIMGRPLIEILLRRLARGSIKKVVVNLHHQSQRVESVLDRAPEGLEIHRSFEKELLGTAGGVKRAEKRLGAGTFALLNGDTLAEFELPDMVRAHRDASAAATLLLCRKPHGSSYSSVIVDDEGRIQRIGGHAEPGRPDLMFAGVWLLEPETLRHLSGSPAGLEAELLPRLVESKAALGYVTTGTFVTLDTPRHYWQACLEVASAGSFREDWAVEERSGDGTGMVLAGPGVTIEKGARFEGVVVLGERTRVCGEAFVSNAICWEDVVLGEGVRVENSVVTAGARIPEDVSLRERLVMLQEGDTSDIRHKEKRGSLVVSELRPMPEHEL